MTETPIEDSITESVYQVHRDRILSAPTTDDFEHLAVGEYIEQMKESAITKIANADAASMKCATFNDFKFVCNFIGVQENIVRDRVYPALRLIGYNKCYHKYKTDGSDIFSDIHTLTSRCATSFDKDAMWFASRGHSFFIETTMKVFRVHKQVATIATKRANECSIRTVDLNLYHALYGLKVLMENEPEYILLRDKNIFASSMIMLDNANKSLLKQKSILEIIVGNP